MYRDKKRGRWRVNRTVNGRRISQYFADRAQAEAFEYELVNGLVKASLKREELTFQDFAERWYQDYCRLQKAPSQWRRDRHTLDLHLIPALGPIKLQNLTKAHLLELQVSLRKKKARPKAERTMSAKSVNNIVNLAKKMLATAVDWDLLKEDAWASVRPLKVAERAYAWWTIEELEAFLAKAREIDPLLTKIVVVAFHTGLRPGEIAALRAQDVNWKTGQLEVKATVCMTTGERSETTKGKRVRYVHMNAAVREALEPVRFEQDPEASVFPMSVFWYLCRRFRRVCKKVKARQIRFYDLRHSFGSNLADQGVDLMQIQKGMGHQSYQMTLRYAHLHPSRAIGLTDVLCAPERKLSADEGEIRKSGGPGRT